MSRCCQLAGKLRNFAARRHLSVLPRSGVGRRCNVPSTSLIGKACVYAHCVPPIAHKVSRSDIKVSPQNPYRTIQTTFLTDMSFDIKFIMSSI